MQLCLTNTSVLKQTIVVVLFKMFEIVVHYV
jgi:hypothetical protein